jgi:YD repeat-containing protein
MSYPARQVQAVMAISVVALFGILNPISASAYAYYGYDPAGRLATALYDNGVCVVYTNDANGNRTSQTSTISGPPEMARWGTGTWGCFSWTAQ